MRTPYVNIDPSLCANSIKDKITETINVLHSNIDIDKENFYIVINGISFDKVSRIARHGPWIFIINENRHFASIPTNNKGITVDTKNFDEHYGRKAITIIIPIAESLVHK